MTKPRECIGCPLYSKGRSFVPSDGPENAPIYLLGEAPGSSEANQGLPFVGDAGVYLNRAVKRLGRTRADYHIGNVIQCQPPKNWLSGAPWEHGAIAHCAVHRHAQWRDHKTYVAMGAIAARTALEEMSSMTMKGKMEGWHGYVVPTLKQQHSYIITLYHPAFLLRGKQKLFGAFLWGHKRAMEVAAYGNKHEEADHYVDPDPFAFTEFTDGITDDPSCWLAVDIETSRLVVFEGENEMPEGTITRISFSYNPDQGVTVPWQPKYYPMIRELLQSKTTKIFCNANYDVPILRANSFPVLGPIHDIMWSWHMLQSDLPKSLGFITPFYSNVMPWKHTASEDPGPYAAKDAVQTLRCAYGITKDLMKGEQWDSFKRYSMYVDQYLREMTYIGVGVEPDSTAALDEHVAGTAKAHRDVMETNYPHDILPYNHILKKPREGFDEIKVRQTVMCCEDCGAEDVTAKHKC